jgi:uncharacterized protein YndB with AHSA1/START domain
MNTNTPIIVEVTVNASVDKVWKAITDKNEMKLWYFDIPDFTLAVGQVFNFYEPGGENKYHHQGEILDSIPNQKLKHTWTYPDLSTEKTIVIWELQPEDENTRVRLTHEDINHFHDLGSSFSRESFTEGWNKIITQNLKSHVEQ